MLPGHPFRGKIKMDQDGRAFVVQMRDVDPNKGIDWESLMRVQLGGRKSPTWLQHDDIIFAARGVNNYAIYLETPLDNTVLSPHFFLIRSLPDSGLLPEFLAWQINQIPAKKYFASSCEGSFTVSIRKAVLESLPVRIPSLAEQKSIIPFARCLKQQKQVIHALENNNERLMVAIANKVLSGSAEGEEKQNEFTN